MHDINVYMHEQVGWDIHSQVGGVRIMNVLRMAEVCINYKLKIDFQRCMVGEVLTTLQLVSCTWQVSYIVGTYLATRAIWFTTEANITHQDFKQIRATQPQVLDHTCCLLSQYSLFPYWIKLIKTASWIGTCTLLQSQGWHLHCVKWVHSKFKISSHYIHALLTCFFHLLTSHTTKISF